MKGCRHTDERTSDNEKAVGDDRDGQTAKRTEEERRRERGQNQREGEHRREKTLTLGFACFFFP